ncbi:MSP domain protein [Oesophagostomum dentatum]|uniref:Major sperm protein n=1 Tax=Oesophagostomum dentatum TaxID=61180 RepID=A0A0B1TI20_OESDE|nr:MSP domain protein [Oesophagostomum dentatum]
MNTRCELIFVLILFDKSMGDIQLCDICAEAVPAYDKDTVPPGEIHAQHEPKIVFNAPYDDKHIYHIEITNASGRRIGWATKTINMRRFGVDPACGVLDPKETTLLAVSCNTFDYGPEDTYNDRITVEWCNTLESAAKQFRREWFQGDGTVRRKNLPIEYIP